ncbi:SDR family NAD(P)-dependent oxidoreductase [Halococcus saccharolyticus]|uniref:Oxidoreductase ykvO n=1 Tax=Halococcus saccharolyticus DSM 5350 TaxID=1227455 RepID=M0MH82_9EURY|nr:glucose 1-dehydrogenase [Halococcus saccharolyticus]EMA45087.1 oxidoreductase ykvO [Halococcus saccharolyticus DSM 5350]
MAATNTEAAEYNERKLENKVAVVTGGNSGIGRAIAERFHAQGASVAIFGRNQETLNETLDALGGEDESLAVRGDVTNPEDLDKLYAAVEERFGRVDVLVANAGVGKIRPFDEVDEDFFDTVTDIDFKGAFFTVQKALPLLSDGGSVMFTTTGATEKGLPGMSVYAAAKAALRSLTRTLAAELAPREVRVNAISPGPVETSLVERMGIPTEQATEELGKITEQQPLDRFGRPEEVAAAAVFLASEDASYVTGAKIDVDGGMAQV